MLIYHEALSLSKFDCGVWLESVPKTNHYYAEGKVLCTRKPTEAIDGDSNSQLTDFESDKLMIHCTPKLIIFTLKCLTYFLPNQIFVFFEKFNFYFMKTANITVYGNIVLYIKYCAVYLKINYTLRCLEYICLVSSPLRRHRLSLRLRLF